MLDCGDRFLSVVGAAQEAQGRRVERLHSERQPVDTGCRKGPETIGFGGIGIGLEGDFDIGHDGPMQPYPVEQRRHSLGRHQRRRATAEKH